MKYPVYAKANLKPMFDATLRENQASGAGRDQLSSLSLVLLVRTLADLATELEERSSSLRLRLRSVSRVLSRTPHLASCFRMPR